MDKPNNLSAMEFFRFDLRVGTILSIEEVPKSKKLLKLEVSFGPMGNRTIIAGLAPRLPDLLSPGPGTYLNEGQRVVAILNLEPRTMMGQTSYGMILAATDTDGKVHPVNPGNAVDGAEVG
jgi:methionine--tRNA ligase beta chain